MKNARYQFNCTDLHEPDHGDMINEMAGKAKDISRDAFIRYVNREDRISLERRLKYETDPRRGLTMRKDWHVGYYRGRFNGKKVVYFTHSRIEFIFSEEKLLP